PFDLRYGQFRIEVKASADVQSWFQRRPSKNVFSIRKALEWDSATGIYSKIPTRCADIYVFCHYPEQDKLKVNLVDLRGWDFYIIPVESVNAKCGEMKSISLSTVKNLAVTCKFGDLRTTVDRLLADRR